MSKRSVVDWLGDIISWGERLEYHIAGMTYVDFIKDAKTQDAASKCAESIGLAANELSKLDPLLEREFPNLQLNRAYKSATSSATATTQSTRKSSGLPSRCRFRKRSQPPDRRSSNTTAAMVLEAEHQADRPCKKTPSYASLSVRRLIRGSGRGLVQRSCL
jgi:hypothetical protein